MLGPEAEKLGWKNGEWLAALVRTKFSTSKKNDRPSVFKKKLKWWIYCFHHIVGDWQLESVNQCDNHLELLLSDTWGVH